MTEQLTQKGMVDLKSTMTLFNKIRIYIIYIIYIIFTQQYNTDSIQIPTFDYKLGDTGTYPET